MKLPTNTTIARRKVIEVCYLAAEQTMKYDLFIRMALTEDLPGRHLRRGDGGRAPPWPPPGQEPGYTLEVFNAVGETVDVVTVRESQIERLTAAELLSVRPMAASTRWWRGRQTLPSLLQTCVR